VDRRIDTSTSAKHSRDLKRNYSTEKKIETFVAKISISMAFEALSTTYMLASFLQLSLT
jgi:hypothetical protein